MSRHVVGVVRDLILVGAGVCIGVRMMHGSIFVGLGAVPLLVISLMLTACAPAWRHRP